VNVDGRVERLAELAGRAGLDAVAVTNDASIAYLTGFHGLQLERFFGVVVCEDGSGTLIAPNLDRVGVEAAPSMLPRAIYPPSSNGLPELASALGSAKKIGVEQSHLIHTRAKALADEGRELVFADELLMALRSRKDEEEVAAIDRSGTAVSEVIEATIGALRVGDVERDVNARVEFLLRERGARSSSSAPTAPTPTARPGSGSCSSETSSSSTSRLASTGTGAT
jgi:Xaa-Pro dipeptidase